MRVFPLLLIVLSAAACGPGTSGAPASAADAAPLTVALVDSVPYENELQSGWLRRVAVRTPTGVDTIGDLLTAQLPVIREDSVVVGFRYQEDLVLGTFWYTAPTKALRDAALPPDFYQYGDPQFSPDGHHVAYLGWDGAGTGYGVVLAWPSGAVRYRSAPVALLPSDAGSDDIAWEGEDRFTIAIAIDTPGAWQRIRGRVTRNGVSGLAIDTVTPPAR